MPEHFADPNHGEIFQVLLTVIQKSGQIADPLTLKNYFESKDRLESIGGAAYIAKLAEEAVLTSSAGEYGRIIYDLYKRRMLVSLGHDIMNRSYDNNLEESASNLIEKAEQNLYELATSDDYDGDLRSFDKSLTVYVLFTLVLDAFMRLIETQKTQDRIKHTLTTGKPLIN